MPVPSVANRRQCCFRTPPRRDLGGRLPVLLAELQVRHAIDESRGGQDRGDADEVGSGKTPQLGGDSAEKGSDEDADTHRSPEGRERSRAHQWRHHLGQIGLPGEVVDRTGSADQQHAEAVDRKRPRSRAELHDAEDEPDDRELRGQQHRPSLADAGRQDPRRNVGDEGTDADQRGDQRGNRRARATLKRRQCDDRQHRALSQAEQGRRRIGGDRNVAEAKLARSLGAVAHEDQPATPRRTTAPRGPFDV